MRARNIKPGFYKNEDLAACSVYARLLAPGLWMMADREGRMEYRPLRIKAEIFPYDSVEVHVLLEELEGAGHIQTFYHGDKRFVQICKFSDHQRPHQNEAQSTIPAPPPKSSQRNQQVAETSHQGSKCFAPREQALRSESVSLFSESPSLNAESLSPAVRENGEAPFAVPAVASATPEVVDPVTAKIHELAETLCARHPAKTRCGPAEARKLLHAIVNHRPAFEKAPQGRKSERQLWLLGMIDENHAAWCSTDQWRRGFAKGLANWLAPTMMRYLTPPAAERPMNGSLFADSKTVRAMEIYMLRKEAEEAYETDAD